MRKPRWIQHLYAVLNGYFWLPCPICGQYFGGHEWEHSANLMYGDRGHGVCGDCLHNGKLAAEQERIDVA